MLPCAPSAGVRGGSWQSMAIGGYVAPLPLKIGNTKLGCSNEEKYSKIRETLSHIEFICLWNLLLMRSLLNTDFKTAACGYLIMAVAASSL